MALAEEVAQWLSDQGHGSLVSDPPTIAIGFMPADPDAVIVITPYPGAAPQHTLGTRAWENPRFQVIVRDATFPLAQSRMQAVHDDLDGVANEVIEGRFYLRIESTQSPGFLRQDTNDSPRTLFVCNFSAMRP